LGAGLDRDVIAAINLHAHECTVTEPERRGEYERSHPGSVTKHLLQMTAFLAISMAVQTLYLLADLYWVGHLGKEAIAAVGVAGNFTMMVLALTQILGVGTTTLISQAAGRKDQSQAELAFNQSFVMSLIVAAGLGIFSFLLRDFYCESLSADAATASLAKSYLLWFIPGLLLRYWNWFGIDAVACYCLAVFFCGHDSRVFARPSGYRLWRRLS
jgi:Na+-driven multidrug efflux pump